MGTWGPRDIPFFFGWDWNTKNPNRSGRGPKNAWDAPSCHLLKEASSIVMNGGSFVFLCVRIHRVEKITKNTYWFGMFRKYVWRCVIERMFHRPVVVRSKTKLVGGLLNHLKLNQIKMALLLFIFCTQNKNFICLLEAQAPPPKKKNHKTPVSLEQNPQLFVQPSNSKKVTTHPWSRTQL